MPAVRPIILGLVGCFLILAIARDARGADAPTVTVKAAGVPLCVATPIADTEGLSVGQLVDLVEQGVDGAPILGQVIPTPNGDGLVDGQRVAVAAVIPPSEKHEGERRFTIRPREGAAEGRFTWNNAGDASIALSEGDSPVLTYNHGFITREDLPETEARRTRSCYIHPLHGLRGETLTDDFPKDHYHHHGVFWTWPHVAYDGKEYDLWTDVGGIQQHFGRWLAKTQGPIAAVLAVENVWRVGDKNVMTERAWITVFRAEDGSRTIDLDFAWTPIDKPITLQGAAGKSYGGLTVRFHPPSANAPESRITVPEGVAKGDLPDTPLPWADYTSKFGEGEELSGGAIFVPESHPDYPPTWLTRYYGPLCIGWPGVNARTFEPGVAIPLHYRLWLHDGETDVTTLADRYDAYNAAEEAKAE